MYFLNYDYHRKHGKEKQRADMNKELVTTTAMVSVAAVERYISLAPQNRNRHLANILVHANGKDLTPSVRFISAKACEDAVEIIIEDFHTIYGDRSNRFTLEDSSFSFVGSTMNIKTENAFGCLITVAITKA